MPGPKQAWELNPHTSSACYNGRQRNNTIHTRPVFTDHLTKEVFGAVAEAQPNPDQIQYRRAAR